MMRLILGFGLAIAVFAWPASGEAGHPYGWNGGGSSWGGGGAYGNPHYPQGPHWGSSPYRSWGSPPYGAYGSPGTGSSWPYRSFDTYDRSRWFFTPNRGHHRHGPSCDHGRRFHDHDHGSGLQFRFR